MRDSVYDDQHLSCSSTDSDDHGAEFILFYWTIHKASVKHIFTLKRPTCQALLRKVIDLCYLIYLIYVSIN